MKNTYSAPTIDELLVEHNKSHGLEPRGQVLEFKTDLPHSGIYNPYIPFEHRGALRIPVRIDPPNSQDGGSTYFFRRNDSPLIWDHDLELPAMPWQDPFQVRIGDRWFFGGVRTYKDAAGDVTDWDTTIMEVADPDELQPMMEARIVGPRHMKGLRPVGMDGKFAGMTTRPIDSRYPHGKVGYLAVDDSSSVTAEALANAPIVEGFIAHEAREWGGITSTYDWGGRKILAGAHLARFVADGSREYFGVLVLAEERQRKLEVIEQKIVACRQCFPETPTKRHDLRNVFYMAGIYEDEAYGGLSDYGVGRISVADSLAELRRLAAA